MAPKNALISEAGLRCVGIGYSVDLPWLKAYQNNLKVQTTLCVPIELLYQSIRTEVTVLLMDSKQLLWQVDIGVKSCLNDIISTASCMVTKHHEAHIACAVSLVLAGKEDV